MSIIFVIGPAASGKSTYIKENFPDYKVVDIYDFQKNQLVSTVESTWISYHKAKDALIKALKEYDNVVLEHTLLRAERRPMYIDAVREVTKEPIDVIVFNLPASTIAERRIERSPMINYDTALNYAEMELDLLEIPTKEEGFNNITIISK